MSKENELDSPSESNVNALFNFVMTPIDDHTDRRIIGIYNLFKGVSDGTFEIRPRCLFVQIDRDIPIAEPTVSVIVYLKNIKYSDYIELQNEAKKAYEFESNYRKDKIIRFIDSMLLNDGDYYSYLLLHYDDKDYLWDNGRKHRFILSNRKLTVIPLQGKNTISIYAAPTVKASEREEVSKDLHSRLDRVFSPYSGYTENPELVLSTGTNNKDILNLLNMCINNTLLNLLNMSVNTTLLYQYRLDGHKKLYNGLIKDLMDYFIMDIMHYENRSNILAIIITDESGKSELVFPPDSAISVL